MYSNTQAVPIPGITRTVGRLLEMLGAAGCAAFFVSACALALESAAEYKRASHAPTVTVRLTSAPNWSGAKWGIQPSESPASAPALVSAPPLRPALKPRPRPKQALVAEPALLLGLTQRLTSEKRELFVSAPVRPSVSDTVHIAVAAPARLRATPPPLKEKAGVSIHSQRGPPPPARAMSIQAAQVPPAPRAVRKSEPEAPRTPEVIAQEQLPSPALPVAVSLPAAPPPPPPAPGHTAAIEGRVSADTQLLFSFRPTEVTLVDSQGNQRSAEILPGGVVQIPPASVTDTEYSFRVGGARRGPALVVMNEGGRQRALAAFSVPSQGIKRLDLREAALEEQPVAGRVLEADRVDASPVEGAEVSLVGDSSRVAITDADGRFELGSISVPAGEELFVEARRPHGFTHRFRVKRGQSQQLFLASEEQIQQWSSAFEGGLSPRSGWVLGAASGKHARAGTQPVIQSQRSQSRIQPETYLLGPENELVPAKEGVTPANGYRWLSVEIPEGEATVRLEDSLGRSVQESWTPVSAGVISVILFDDEE